MMITPTRYLCLLLLNVSGWGRLGRGTLKIQLQELRFFWVRKRSGSWATAAWARAG